MQANKVWPVKLQEQPLAEQSITSTVFCGISMGITPKFKQPTKEILFQELSMRVLKQYAN